MCRITRSPLGPYFNSMRNWLAGCDLDFLPIPDVAFALEHLGQAALHFGERHIDVRPLNAHGVADAGQHIGDGIGHHVRVWVPLTNSPFDAGNQPLVGQLAEANAADAELAIHGPRPAAQLGSAARSCVENFGFRFAFAIFDLLAMRLCLF